MNKEQLTLIQSVFKTPSGGEVLKLLKDKAFFNDSTFSIDSPTAMAFNEGKRDLILWLTKVINVDITKLTKIKQQEPENFFK